MKRRLALRSLMLAGAVLVFSASRAQEPSKTQEPDFTIRSDVRLVLLDVSVKDHQGGFVSGLTKDNFRVTEDGKPQQITVFANEDLPVTVGILVDESFSMTPKRPDVLTAAQTFITESNPQDEIFVLNFNDTVKRGLPEGTLFSGDIQQLRAALFNGMPQGKTALYDAVSEGLKQLKLGRRDKKALIVISDGGDNASSHTRAEMINEVEGGIATIYTIGLFDAEDPDRNPGILNKLAKISGGEAFFPASPKEMVPVCRRIAKDIRTRYTVGYAPQEKGAGTLRHIQVHVSAPGRSRVSARTRTTYRYDAVPTQTADRQAKEK